MSSINDSKKLATGRAEYQLNQPRNLDWVRRLSPPPDGGNAGWQEELNRVLALISDFSQPGRLLDLACGEGEWTSLLAQRASVVALDYSPAGLSDQSNSLNNSGGEQGAVKFVRGDVFRLPFHTDSFDRCFCGFGLSLVPTTIVDKFLAELSRVVRTGGRVLFVDSLIHPEKSHQSAQQTGELNGDRFTPATLRAAIWPFAQDVEIFRTRHFFVIANFVVRAR